MASSLPDFASTQENTNYARLCRLLVDVGCTVLRDTFDSIHPPANLHVVLSSPLVFSTLQSLRKKKVLNPIQWGKLFPAVTSRVSSANFDVTLLMVLLRNICGLSPPVSTGNWDKLPPDSDNSTEANIVRIKFYRNDVYGHATKASVDDATFNALWQKISSAVLALGTGYGDVISRLKTECMDPGAEAHYEKLLSDWKKDDDSIKEMLERTHDALGGIKENSRMASSLPDFASTQENTNYARLCRLLVDVGCTVLRDTFDSIHPPANLHVVLSSPLVFSTLQSLRKKKVLNPIQWGKLFPAVTSRVSSANFDVTLLMVLLRNICGLSPPVSTGNWDKLPPDSDNSTEANIVRIKFYRNDVYGHATKASVDDATFNALWQKISSAVLALGTGYGDVISRLKTECMDPGAEAHYEKLLSDWKKDDDSIKEMLERTHDALGGIKENSRMASSLPDFASTQENTNYARLCRLLVDVGCTVLRDTFDSIHPPANLHVVLSSPLVFSTLQSLRKKKVLNPIQWGKLFPAVTSRVSSANFDVTLLMVLLRNICGLSPPVSTGNWDKLPPDSDNSTEANIVRIKFYRNDVYGHATKASVDDATFNALWQKISSAVLALGTGYGDVISRLKTECMDPGAEAHYEKLLSDWKKDDDSIKEMLERTHDALGGIKENSRMASSLPDFASTQENTNYARLCRLLVDVGCTVLRDTFDSIHPPANLHVVLSSPLVFSTLQSLRKKKVLNPIQWGKLFPAVTSRVSSANFDVTLLMVLLRNICGLSPPVSTGNWDKLPPDSDNSTEANIVRIKFYRNDVYGHATKASVDDATFNALWQKISSAVLALGTGYGDVISRLKTECMDPGAEAHYEKLLSDWKKDDDSIKEMLERTHDALGGIKENSRMASSLPDFASTQENTNYARLCRLLVDVGCTVLRDTFDSIHPPANLHVVLSSPLVFSTLQSLRKKKVLNPIQWGKLFPAVTSRVSSANFDVTLLMVLLRNICGLSPPVSTGNWDKLPPDSDNSTEANIVRIKFYRNDVYGHATKASVDDATFNALWQKISSAVLALGTGYGDVISRLKTECMDPGAEAHYEKLLSDWKKDDDSIKEMLERTHDALGGIKENSRMASSLPDFASTQENTNYARLCRLLVDVGCTVLRDTFDSIHPPANLHVVLSSPLVFSTLQSLRKKKVLNPIQWGKLFPAVTSRVSSANFDVTLLMVLLRNICGLSPPVSTGNWDKLPPDSDNSTEANIVRIKFYRNDVYGHATKASVDDATFNALWQKISSAVLALGTGYGDVISRLKTECMDPGAEAHYEKLLSDWEKDDDSIKEMLERTHDALGGIKEMIKQQQLQERITKESLKDKQVSDPFDLVKYISIIRQLYEDREGWLAPFPWYEEFRFNLDKLFTRLKFVSRKRERGIKTDVIVDMFQIFQRHQECAQPRRVLIEGQPGMGKTTYCQKIAYDWAKKRKGGESFPDVTLVLLLKCRDINCGLWEAIDDQLLPREVNEEEKERFFTFIRDHQSKVLLVLDGLDELPRGQLSIYTDIIQGRVLPESYIVVTAQHEDGMKVRECCHTLLEIEGFTKTDAKEFILRYFKEEHLAEKLLNKLESDMSLQDLTRNPLNTALLCLLCEDFGGKFPESRTLLYLEIVECVLRRYRRKMKLPETKRDLLVLYEVELKQLGFIAMEGLHNDSMYFDESAFKGFSSNVKSGLGFLSVEAGRSKQRPSRSYAFLHKSFQEFFAALFHCCQLLDEEISVDSLVADCRYFQEFQQVLMFTSGLLAQKCEGAAKALIAGIATQVNLGENLLDESLLYVALDCIYECKIEGTTFDKEMAQFFGSHLKLQRADCKGRRWR
ncbi:uncharacterized protein LOC141889495 isoform X1 [Acropora palmata]|uniref:uncharacterized protein LOC141889495 isoform X1 n=1 Tax=Acropora palmata TaxID=6131 RepID=UPI003DA1C11B